jgi:histidinol-phosphate phosphatase family protein
MPGGPRDWTTTFDIVVPTTGRPSLGALLAGLTDVGARRITVVDDRVEGGRLRVPAGVELLRSGGRGPAAARNVGWRAGGPSRWVAFLDDDVQVGPEWGERLVEDLELLAATAGASQGHVRVALPHHRRPTDWERNVAALQDARWITADLCVRRAALASVGGFDERFPRAYREDADLALRLMNAGWTLHRGARAVEHPIGRAGPWVSVAKQAGNADDVVMDALHGRDWRERAGAPRGRLRAHLATTALGATALGAALAGRPRAAGALAAGWGLATGELAWRRIAPGPRTRREVATMAATSAVLPVAASFHHLRGRARARARSLEREPSLAPRPARRPAAVLLDRDGTLVVDVPYNADPERVVPVPGARRALDRLRASGVLLAVVTNQSGIGRGLMSADELAAVNERIEALLGPLGPWLVCPHDPDAGCGCRKPRPGLVLEAASRLGVAPERCAVVGDIASDIQAAGAAGARGVLVPNERTRAEEIVAAPEVAGDLDEAVDMLIGAP